MPVEVFWGLWLKKTSCYPSEVKQVPKHWPAALSYKLEKWFPLHGERAHSLYFCIYIRRLEVSKNNRNVKEEETEQTY